MQTSHSIAEHQRFSIPSLKQHIQKSFMLTQLMALHKFVFYILQVHMRLLVSYLSHIFKTRFQHFFQIGRMCRSRKNDLHTFRSPSRSLHQSIQYPLQLSRLKKRIDLVDDQPLQITQKQSTILQQPVQLRFS